jgi:hypothetical protein
MPALKTYDLFISHAWTYNEEYHRLVGMLHAAPNFHWRNYSVPDHDPLQARTTAALKAGLDRQIRPVNAVLILSGMYVNHREWLQAEIEMAQAYRKPIIGVVPWGAERVPALVQSTAAVVVRWNTDPIVSAIRSHAL